MFGGPRDGNLSSSPNWGALDKDITKLLEDVPRATSAPPTDRWPPGSADPTSSSRAWTGIEHADIRFDEDYARFYEAYSGQRKLPPPVEGRTLYSELGLLQQKQQMLAAHQQAMLSSAATPPPSQAALLGIGGALTPAGLEVIQEQGPNNGLVQAFHQLAVRGSSPAPRLGNGELAALAQLGSKPGTPFEAALQALGTHSPAAAAAAAALHPALSGQAAHTPPPQLPHPGLAAMNGLTAASPPPSAAAAAAAAAALQQQHLAAAAAAGVNPLLGGGIAQSPEYMAAYTAAYQAALMSQPSMLPAPGMNPQLAALQAAQAAALGSYAMPPPMPNLQQQVLAAAVQQQLAGMQAGPYGAYGGNPAAAAAAAANAGRMHLGAGGPGASGHNGRGDGSGGGFDRDEGSGGGSRGGGGGGGGGGDHGKQRGSKGGKDSGRDGGRGAGRRGDRDKDAASHDEGIAHFSARFQNLEDVAGQLLSIAQDQNGCRFLQRKFDEGGAAAIAAVFTELLEHATELMTDPFGNYLVQKLLDRCSEEQRFDVLKRVCEKGQIVEVALNTHGTRAVQKLIETLTSREQRALVISALRPGVVSLIKDLNGNHVVQRCLQRLGPDDSQFVYDAAGAHCVEVATHRHGCCVLQRCIDFATPQQKAELVGEIAKHALSLSQDAFGNYVVQYVLELGQTESSRAVMNMLVGHYAELSMQKFSSNVVEKCLKLGGLDPERQVIIQELLQSPLLPRLLQDSYGNYVVQSALAISSGAQHQELVDAIKPFLPSLRGTPHGKRILQKIHGKV